MLTEIYSKYNKYRKRKNICSAIIYSIIALIIILLVLVIYNNKTGKLDKAIKYDFYTVISGSMRPEINIGDVVIIEKTDKVEVGDIIAYKASTKVETVHRVVKKRASKGKITYITKGDCNNSLDVNPVSQEQVQGVCKFVIPKVGLVAIFINKYYIAIIYISIILILILMLIYVCKNM